MAVVVTRDVVCGEAKMNVVGVGSGNGIVENGDRETRRYVEEMEEKSGKVCEKCGRTGDLAVSNGWLFATCEECANERGREFRWLEVVQKEQSLKKTVELDSF